MKVRYISVVGYVFDNGVGKKVYHVMEDRTPKTRTAAKAMLKSMAKEAKEKESTGIVDLMIATEEHVSATGVIVREFEYVLMRPTKGAPGNPRPQKNPTWKSRVPKQPKLRKHPKEMLIDLLSSFGGRSGSTFLVG